MSRLAARTLDPGGSFTSHDDHPLSPSSHPSHPSLHRRISSNAPATSYFESEDTHNDMSRASGSSNRGRRGTNATEADLLGVGPSRRLGKSAGTSRGTDRDSTSRAGDATTSQVLERTRSRRSWRVFLQSLSKEELAVIETNFDAMSDEQLHAYLAAFDASPAIARDSALPIADGPKSSVRVVPPDPPPYAPDAVDPAEPLFPPSPPGEAKQELVDHPLRILSRAVRELREVVESLEEENEKLRLLKQAGGVSTKRRDRQADQVSSFHARRGCSRTRGR